MNLCHLKDMELLTETKRLVENERHLLTQVLHHLCEVERRKLFCDLGFSSLFDYAVKELKYSEGQAVRRIRAMRLMKELPEVEEKIASGKLSLTHLSQAQSYFREAQKQPAGLLTYTPTHKPMDKTQKLNVLARLENTSTREGEKILLKMQPQAPLPKERERVITDEHTEVRFVMNSSLKRQLEDVRALLGPKGANMNLAELVAAMANLSVETLKAKKFGKKRTQEKDGNCSAGVRDVPIGKTNHRHACADGVASPKTPPSAPAVASSTRIRYIPRSVQHTVWTRDCGTCVKCGSQRNISYDHLKPVALSGASTTQNLQLLCFNCNRRRAIKTFGINQMECYPKN